MSMNLALVYEHPSGARHKIELLQTPTTATNDILGIKPEEDGFDSQVTASYEEIRDRYLAWVSAHRYGVKQARDDLKLAHILWTAAGFQPMWYEQ